MNVPKAKKARKVRVPAYAKINLALRVLHKRPDQFHELRTIFQTISLRDMLEIEYDQGERGVELASSVEIANNIVARAAEAVLAETGARGGVRIRLEKKIPMGGGLGGGSTDAAAVLLALPALTGKKLPAPRLAYLAAQLGSDVPFFLLGGTAVGIGRGEEVHPFPEPKPAWGVLWAGGVHVSTAEAYQDLGRQLTVTPDSFTMNEFQSSNWSIRGGVPLTAWSKICRNDFENVIFDKHPQLLRRKRSLIRAGAEPALMTGSGSAVFGFFPSRAHAEEVCTKLNRPEAALFHTLNRARYQAEWMKGLKEYVRDDQWPPVSR